MQPDAERTPLPSGPTFEALAAQFDYDRAEPLEPRSVGVEGALGLEDLSWRSPRGGRVPAWLLVPRRQGRHAAILFLHASTRDRDDLLGEARQYPERGAVCLTMTAAHSRPGRARFPSWTNDDREGVIQDVVDLRRALDLLLEREDVDPARLGFVGLSYGADYGAVFCAVDGRLRAAALISGGTLRDWYARNSPEDLRTHYLALMETVAPDRYLPLVTRTRLLFQNGRNDPTYTRREIDDYHSSARGPNDVIWYDTGHWLNADAARDRAAWLARQLELDAEAYRGL